MKAHGRAKEGRRGAKREAVIPPSVAVQTVTADGRTDATEA